MFIQTDSNAKNHKTGTVMIYNRLSLTIDSRITYLYSQFLLDAVETFARKFDCLVLVTNECRRRIASNGNASELYRYRTEDPKSIFAAHEEHGMIYIHEYNPINDRWELYRNISIAGLSRENFGLVYAENKIFLNGGYAGQLFTGTVSCSRFSNSGRQMILKSSRSTIAKR